MKKLVFVSTFALASFMMMSCNSKTEAAEASEQATTEVAVETTENTTDPAMVMETTTMSVDRMEHDFGKIPDTAPVETTFTITNTGDKPLMISNAQGSCGCTVPEVPQEPIAPGESADMKVSFNPAGKEGAQTKTVTITANTDPATTILNIKSDVKKTAQ